MSTTSTDQRDAASVVRAAYDAFDRRDVPGLLALLDPEVEVRQSDEVPWGGTHRGTEAVLGFFATLASHIETRVDVERLIVAGDTVVEIGRTCGRAVATGREFAIDEAHVWHVRDGRIMRMEAYVDNAAMLAAISDEAAA